MTACDSSRTDRPAPRLPPGFVAGNHFDKYGSRNPVHRLLVRRFVGQAGALAERSAPTTILEVGCGNGDFAARLAALGPGLGAALRHGYTGTDICPEQVASARAKYPGRDFRVASVYGLPFADRSIDLVIACEVFEHLDDPGAALDEVWRVCRGHLLLSVPWEPWWRVLNCLRGRYLGAWGNTPGHVQHFSRGAIRRLVGRRFRLVAERRPFPWTMLLACPGRPA